MFMQSCDWANDPFGVSTAPNECIRFDATMRSRATLTVSLRSLTTGFLGLLCVTVQLSSDMCVVENQCAMED